MSQVLIPRPRGLVPRPLMRLYGRWSALLALAMVGVGMPTSALADATAAGPVRIADTNSSVPGVATQFSKFSSFPSLRGGDVLFSGQWSVPGENGQGMYLYDGASVVKIVDTSDHTPDHGEPFFDFNNYAFDGLNAVFENGYGPYDSLYGYNTNSRHLTTLANVNTIVSSADGKLSGYLGSFGPSADAGNVALGATVTNIGAGIWTNVGGTIRPLADRTTAAPGQPDHLLWYFDLPILRGDKVAFSCGFVSSDLKGSSQQGIYVGDARTGAVTRIADATTTPLGGTGTWGPPLGFDGTSISFTDRLGTTLFTNVGGTLHVAADTSTLMPGSSARFANFGVGAMDDERIAFTAASVAGGPYGLFLWDDGTISQILAPGGTLDGKAVSNVALGPDGFSGNEVAFTADFTDGSSGIYLMQIPEPQSLGLLVAVAGALLYRPYRR